MSNLHPLFEQSAVLHRQHHEAHLRLLHHMDGLNKARIQLAEIERQRAALDEQIIAAMKPEHARIKLQNLAIRFGQIIGAR